MVCHVTSGVHINEPHHSGKFFCLLARHLKEGGSTVSQSIKSSQSHSEAAHPSSNTQIG